MNEIELLNELRSEVPAEQDLRAEEMRLMAEIRGGAPTARKVGRARIGVAVAAALGLAAAAVAVAQLGAPAEQVTRPTTSLLENAALVAAGAKAADIRPDQWFYLKETQHMGGGLPEFEVWSRMDGVKQAVRENGKLKLGQEKGPTNPAKTQLELEALPTDPDALLAHFRNAAQGRTPLSICEPNCPPGTELDVKAFGTIGWYLKYGPIIPPDTRAGMFRALAKIPNVKVEENTRDADGRTGIGVVLDLGQAGKGYYILNPGDYRYLGTKVVSSDGTTLGMGVLASGIVDEPGDVPPE